MERQMTFNDNSKLDINSVKFSEEEDAALEEAVNLIKDTVKSSIHDIDALISIGEQFYSNACMSERAAKTLCSFCQKDEVDTPAYVEVKNSLSIARVFEHAALAICQLAEELSKESKETVSLDRLPGETAEEHKARLRAFLEE